MNWVSDGALSEKIALKVIEAAETGERDPSTS
jgi:hypothetical protein